MESPNSNGTPGGNVSAPQSSGTPSGAGNGAGNLNVPANTPSVIDISDDTMVRLPGAKDPVRYGDHYRNFQSEFTKRSQDAQRLRQQVQQAQQKIKEFESRQRQQQNPQGQPAQQSKLQELASNLKSLTYLNGEQAASVVDHVMQEMASSQQELHKRDTALALMYRQMKSMDQQLKQLYSQHTNTSFDSKITRFVKDSGLPEKAADWAKKLYLAYEGDDLDQEFPKILKQEWEAIGGLVRDTEKQKLERARQVPFVPGRGGNGTPSKPLEGFAKKSAKDIADAFWPGMVDGEVET